MKDLEKLKLDEDFGDILKQTISNLIDLGLKKVTVDHILYFLIYKHIEGDEDSIVSQYFGSLSPQDRHKVLSVCNDYMNEVRTFSENNKDLLSQQILSIDNLWISEGVRKIFDFGGEEITSYAFLLKSSVDCESDERVSYILRNTKDIIKSLELASFVVKRITPNDTSTEPDSNDHSGEDRDMSSPGMDYNKNSIENDDREFETAGSDGNSFTPSSSDPNSDTPYLDTYSIDLNKQYKEGRFDPIIGRESEISQLIEVLSCRKKKNAILTAPGGVGKTSVVIGLVQAIETGNVPRELKGRTIRSLDITAMVSGSTYRGDFEKKIQGVLQELVDHPEIIAFIDEIHNIVGAGSNTDGKGDASTILKPYLSGVSGNITVIGATTDDEYRKFIESDGALKRRFQEIVITEPGIEETVEILSKIASKFEEFHKVKYTPEVIRACVEWSGVYINDRNFPDKAIDCLDVSGSLAKLGKIIDTSTVETLENSIKEIIDEKIDLVGKCEFEEAQKKRDLELELTKKLDEEKNKLSRTIDDPSNWAEVTMENVASVISKISKVPIDKIRQTTLGKLRSMKKSMEATVIGQDQAINEVSLGLNRQFLGLKDVHKPTSMLFCGSTGTGKTYLAKIIAKELFGTEKALIRIDCSLYTSDTSSQKLLGSDPGYVGYNGKTILHEVKRRPFSVVLFDEIEKMNEGVINTLFLPLLDEGEVVLSNGEKISFKNCIIIMTSNIGTKELENKTNLGFGKVTSKEKERDENKEIVMKAIRKKMRPELLGRLGSIVFFNNLGESDLLKIFDLELQKLNDRIGERGFVVKVTDEAKKFIISKCDMKYGARELQKQMTTFIEDKISEGLMNLDNSDNPGKNITIDLDGDDTKAVFDTVMLVGAEKKVKA